MDPTLMIHDVKEKEIGAVSAPSFPAAKSLSTGFPQPKNRKRVSAFKQQRQGAGGEGIRQDGKAPSTRSNGPDLAPVASAPQPADEKRSIDRENRERIQNMSPEEIAQARQELMSDMDPALLRILLRRANLDEGAPPPLPFEEDAEGGGEKPPQTEYSEEDTTAIPKENQGSKKAKKSVSFAPVTSTAEPSVPEPSIPETTALPEEAAHRQEPPLYSNEDAPPAIPPPDLFPITSPDAAKGRGPKASTLLAQSNSSPGPGTVHFPQAAPVPDLDPSDPDFLRHLHDKYFPNLPADPSKLAWMAPLPAEDSAADRASPYHPERETIPFAELRFDFRGRMVSPLASRAIPSSRGLHHHGDAPEAAGYTIPELARLGRSAVPAQRCVAFQTLGRILYRLGRGEWGDGAAGADDVASGLWACIRECRVMETLRDAASVEEGRGHYGARAYAIEAVWLFEKGGWRERRRAL